MKKKVLAAGLLAGGIALTGLTGSAYAEGSAPAKTPTAKPALPPKGHGPVAVACHGTARPFNELPPLPKIPKATVLKLKKGKVVAGSAKKVKIVRSKDGRVTVTVGTPPKGLPLPPKVAPQKGARCVIVKPGTPGAPPAR